MSANPPSTADLLRPEVEGGDGPRAHRVEALDDPAWALAFDPQTAGGLLVALPDERADSVLESLRDAGEQAARIGRVESPDGDAAPVTLLGS